MYGLDDWTFDFSNEKRAVGRCFYDKRKIVFSKHFVDLTPMQEIEDTLRHEIAHALVGSGHGHDETWRNMAHIVGARPQRCATSNAKTSSKPNYLIKCPKCNRVWKRYRLKKAIHSATHCGVPVVIFRMKNEM